MGLYRTVYYWSLVTIILQFIITINIVKAIPRKSTAVIDVHDNVCRTPECYETANEILSNIDPGVEPCDNFYKFSCGGFLKRVSVPEGKQFFEATSQIHDKIEQQLKIAIEEPSPADEPDYITSVKNFYKSCTNKVAIEERGIEFLKRKLKELGGWPVLEGEQWNETNFNLIELIQKFRQSGLPIDIFWYLSLDRSNNTILELDQPSLSLPREELVAGMHTRTEAYHNLMVDIAVMFGASRDYAIAELQESLNFEMNLARKLPNSDTNETRMTIPELSERFPDISWNEYFNNILEPRFTANDITLVRVCDLHFLSELIKLMSVTSERIKANFMMWRAVEFAVPYLRENLTFTNYVEKVNSTNEPRWNSCLSKVKEMIPTHILYVRKYCHESVRRDVNEMEKNIRIQLKKALQTINWMDNDTKSRAGEKIDTASSRIAYPDEFLNETLLEETFHWLKFNDNNYLKNELAFARYKLNEKFNEPGRASDSTNWKNYALIASTFMQYIPWTKSMDIPIGSLQGVLYNITRPKYLNYGAIGSLIGHEMIHAVNYGERHSYMCGKEDPPFSEGFQRMAQCFIDQYSNYTVEEIGKKVDGWKTRDENIADNAGYKIAYLAYKDWVDKHSSEKILPKLKYNSLQLFWIAAANVHCGKFRQEHLEFIMNENCHSLSEPRILGAFQNSRAFADDFKCSNGSKMNPEKKCSFL